MSSAVVIVLLDFGIYIFIIILRCGFLRHHFQIGCKSISLAIDLEIMHTKCLDF